MHGREKKCLGTKILFLGRGNISQRLPDKGETIKLIRAGAQKSNKKKLGEKIEGDIYGHQRSTETNFRALACLPVKGEVWLTCSPFVLFYLLSIHSRSALEVDANINITFTTAVLPVSK